MTSSTVSRLRAIAGIDFHVAVTLLFRSWSIVAGGVMVLVIPTTLAPQEQGYYYTFMSLLGLQIFFELGLNQVIVQLVSQEVADLSPQLDGRVIGDSRHLERMTSIVSLLRKWYTIAAILFLVVTAGVGTLVFERTGSLPRSAWLVPWLALVAATAVNLRLSPMLAVIEGWGGIGQVARLRLVQSLIGYGLVWASLLLGAGLWSVPLIAAVAAICTGCWLRAGRHPLRIFGPSVSVPGKHAIDWRREVFPFQWRIAVSWISGYLMFQLFTPLMFVNLGAVAAGRLGIALTIFSALLSVGVSWINARLPALSAQIARGQREQLRHTFRAVMIRAATLTIMSAALVPLVIACLRHFGIAQLDRIADLPTLLCIAAATAANVVIYGAASFMRAHREEPMLAVSVVGGLLVLTTSYFASQHSAFLTMLLQAIVTCGISLPWTLALFRAYYRRSAT